MTFEEKVAQLVGYWVDQGSGTVAPMQGQMAPSASYDAATSHGLGHLTRVYGTRPVDPEERAKWLWSEQQRLRTETRLGIPAIVHEECLTGLAAWTAATFPTPLAWGATFDPALVERMARSIGGSMRMLGIHQGLAPVLDVIRDVRWGRVDECIGEDPYLVGTLGTSYVRGLQSAGVHATLKHFVGYSASQAGRNHAPVHAGPREIADVFLPPFEMAVRDGGARSVMNSYSDIDGVSVLATRKYLTTILREQWGFDGVVVSDYFAVDFLRTMHGVAANKAGAAVSALDSGLDVELPAGDAFAALDPASDAVVELVDRAVLRVLAQKDELGLLSGEPDERPESINLDTAEHRAIARDLAAESVVLLSNDGVLPLVDTPQRIAVIGPNADDSAALMGCYSFANHVLPHHPDVPLGIEVPSLLSALREHFTESEIGHVAGCDVEGEDSSGILDAVEMARSADIAVVVVGDRAGLFGRGTVGEGNDTEDLELPGMQRALVEAVTAAGTPTIMILLTGRPYVLGWALDGSNRPAAVLQAFFPGEEGARAITDIMTGVISPSGRLPVSLPRSSGSQPYSYLRPTLGGPSEITSLDSTPTRPFGYGLSYTTFRHGPLIAHNTATDGDIHASVTVTNVGDREGCEVVQLYGRDVVGSVVRPTAQLLAFARVSLEPGQAVTVAFEVPTTRLAFSNRDLVRIVEPGRVELWTGNAEMRLNETAIELTGHVYELTAESKRVSGVRFESVTTS